MSYVRIDNVTKHFQDAQVLKNVSLTIEKGELVTLLGPSGCGKSTLLRCIAGLHEIDAGGRMYIGDTDITQLAPKERSVGMVFQSYALFPNMNVYENISFGLKMKGMSPADYRGKVEKMIQLVDLTGREKSYPHQLSGGQQQRVALARSLVVEPKVLLLDEPLSALDAKIRKSLQIELKKIQQELSITTIFVTHDQEEALTVSDRVFIMNKGELVQYGSPADIYAAPTSEFVARFIGSYNVFTARELGALTGVNYPTERSYAIRPEVISLSPGDQFGNLDATAGWEVPGTVRSVTLKGNVIRYQVDVHEVQLSVDVLNSGALEWCQVNTPVTLTIPRRECIPLRQGG
ncbi:ABC transporter ATP-binding protein [Brevibacillus fluminis]|uniref:Carnitine transport ATP-binding protein OpuCA n=1 Tax=Brevibacillus fluminis TaxID=511487 RepID=A0A3M8DAX9_9BACL|nr:ABC transporter ATP-binding protein [Brevibacillus fluminis]RNB84465.1 ABC transporter ATP-binding protein [Brevibacillus fluminis]